MTPNEYQCRCSETAVYPRDRSLEYLGLGLASEAGEVAGKIKKWIRDNTPQQELERQVMQEVSDVLWYCARLLSETGHNMEDCMKYNVEKLASRKERGVIAGSGDNR